MSARTNKFQKDLGTATLLVVIVCAFLSAYNPALGQVNSFPYNEGFEGSSFPPSNWSVGHVKGTTDWQRSGIDPYSGDYHANSTGPAAGAKKRLDVSVSFQGYFAGQLSYRMKRSPSIEGLNPRVEVQYSTDGANFSTLRTINAINDINSTNYVQFIDLLPNALDDQASVILRWEHNKDGGSNAASVRLDLVEITVDGLIPVELISFLATATEEGVNLHWSTATETENLGFHIYRSEHETNDYLQITNDLILGTGNSAEAHTYSYTDRNVKVGKTYYYKLADVNFNGEMEFHGPVAVTVPIVPEKYNLEQNYPNPFNPETTIKYGLKTDGEVSLKVYNLLGQVVGILVNEHQKAGYYTAIWDGRDAKGVPLPAGIYFYSMSAGGFKSTKRMVLLK